MQSLIPRNLLFLCAITLTAQASAESRSYWTVGGERFQEHWVSSVSMHKVSQTASNTQMTIRLTALHASVRGSYYSDEEQLAQPDQALDEDDVRYSAIEAGVGIRVGSVIYGFAEYGQDLGETLMASLLEKDEDNDGENDGVKIDIDRSFSVGLGLSLNQIDVRAFTKYRHISGIYADTQQHWFRGVEVSLRFK